jgi:hypothetical protein
MLTVAALALVLSQNAAPPLVESTGIVHTESTQSEYRRLHELTAMG